MATLNEAAAVWLVMLRKLESEKQARLRILIVDESEGRAATLAHALNEVGYEIAGQLLDPLDLTERVSALQPDVVVIGLDSPSRGTLEHLCVMSRDKPRPVVMFTHDDDSGLIHQAVRSGVSAYVVGGLSRERIKPIVEVAIARFEQHQLLRDELKQAKTDLMQRKVIERAKGILMKQRGIGEQQAYEAMRKLAMGQNKRLFDVAQNILDVSSLLGAGTV